MINDLFHQLQSLRVGVDVQKSDMVLEVADLIKNAGYSIVELNDTKPWGAYIRIAGDEADSFVETFFSGLTPKEARFGVDGAELSPKILIVDPGQRLSWQYHNRRAERWKFLTSGRYSRSRSDDEQDVIEAKAGDIIQFDQGERHRLSGVSDQYVIVAEIWQHVNKDHLSDEDDIIRLADDYQR